MRRSRILRDVKYFPSFPANGLLLIKNVICKVGSSIRNIGNASGCSLGQIVSPMLIFSIPVTARSEERRVGKECRCRERRTPEKKQEKIYECEMNNNNKDDGKCSR